VAGRALAFSDPEVLRFIRENYVAVAADDWYQRRRQDATGAFFRKVADQGPRKGEGGSTRQGLYCLTGDGRLLAYRNHARPDAVRALLEQGLARWKALERTAVEGAREEPPESRRDDPRYARRLPEGGLVLRVHARELELDEEQGYRPAPSRHGSGSAAPSLDHLWLEKEEWQALIPAAPQPGSRFPLPPAVVRRIARFHLVDNTRGEPPMWRADEVREARLELVAREVTESTLAFTLEGRVSLEERRGTRGYEARVLGAIEHDRQAGGIRRFDVVAIGEHWGEGPYTRGARPGRTPLGIAFVLAAGDRESDKVPPQAARDLAEYFGRLRP
jgi:hypothetical protein